METFGCKSTTSLCNRHTGGGTPPIDGGERVCRQCLHISPISSHSLPSRATFLKPTSVTSPNTNSPLKTPIYHTCKNPPHLPFPPFLPHIRFPFFIHPFFFSLLNLQKQNMPPLCASCMSAPATLYCPADNAHLCPACDLEIHSANKLVKRHVRRPISPSSSSYPTTNPNSNSNTPTPGSTPGLDAPSHSWASSPKLKHHHRTSSHAHSQHHDANPLSLEMIASVCVRREAEALCESSGCTVPSAYLRSRYSLKNQQHPHSHSNSHSHSHSSSPSQHQHSLHQHDIHISKSRPSKKDRDKSSRSSTHVKTST